MKNYSERGRSVETIFVFCMIMVTSMGGCSRPDFDRVEKVLGDLKKAKLTPERVERVGKAFDRYNVYRLSNHGGMDRLLELLREKGFKDVSSKKEAVARERARLTRDCEFLGKDFAERYPKVFVLPGKPFERVTAFLSRNGKDLVLSIESTE